MTYVGKWYNVQGLSNDAKAGNYWVPKPTTWSKFESHSELVVIKGCFQHNSFKRLSTFGTRFTNLICIECSQIP